MQNIYPRYLVAGPTAGPDGLTLRGFRDGTPYQGEELVFESQQPEHFLARCSLRGRGQFRQLPARAAHRRRRHHRALSRATGSTGWRDVAAGIDKLIARLHPN